MKTIVNFTDFQELNTNYNQGFSYEALKALFEYYENLEEDTGEEIELDPSLLWDFSEYQIEDLISEYKHSFGSFNTEDFEDYEDYKEDFLNWVQDRTTVIKLNEDSYLIGAF